MKIAGLLFTVLLSATLNAQNKEFPVKWSGDWKGEVHWYKTGSSQPVKVAMEIRIHPTFKADVWTWQIIYGEGSNDNRPYKLMAKDSSGVHWVIDENNGVLLDQYWVANKLCGVFTVANNTIINNYHLEGDTLIAEFYNFNASPVATTGSGTSESPKVDSYLIGGYQKAVLKRVY
jgi:hypothetical protein